MFSSGMKLLASVSALHLLAAVLIFFISLCCVQPASADPSISVYIGTYTGEKSKGIYLSHFDTSSGKLTPPELAAETKSPSFLAIHPNKRFLYAVGEVSEFNGKKAGAVSAFEIETKDGHLRLLNQQPSGGTGPCHLSVDKTGKCVLAANYGSGSIAAFPIGADGKLGEAGTTIQHQGSSVNAQRQAGPHAHFITPDPANRFALVCDLGLDKVLVYKLDPAKASLVANDPPSASIKPGEGPRHLVFHPNGNYVYNINEMGSSLTVLGYNSRRGALNELQTVSTLPENSTTKNTCAEVQVHPTGKFVYGSNRGDDSIAVFSVDAKTGKLTLAQNQSTRGKTPRHFAIDPTGKWLLAENQASDNVVVFSIDPKSGHLTPADQEIKVGSPVCVVFL